MVVHWDMTQALEDTFDVELMFEEIAPTPLPTPVPPAPSGVLAVVAAPAPAWGRELTLLVDQLTDALRARVAEELEALNAGLNTARADAARCQRLADQWRSYGEGMLRENQKLACRCNSLEAQLSVARQETDTLISRIRRREQAPDSSVRLGEAGAGI